MVANKRKIEHKRMGLDLRPSVAIFIAFLAVTVSLWQGCEQRRHNRLSVTPALGFHYNLSEEVPGEQWGWYIKNQGIGPAHIERLAVAVNDTLILVGPPVEWERVLAAAGFPRGMTFSYSVYHTATWLKAGASDRLFGVDSQHVPQADYPQFKAALLSIDMMVTYASVYGEVTHSSSDPRLPWGELLEVWESDE